ncbi:MAG TPA: alpha-glucan family phosphorylase [Burkholderiales bacterium]|nr:alpha-glucan family phosphorylase [Burkholderiales bacterium]
MQPVPGTTFSLGVNPRIPPQLSRLEELANNLWYSWDRATRTLFARLHPALWDSLRHSPKAFLKYIDQQRLLNAASDPLFMHDFERVLAAYDSYRNEPMRATGKGLLPEKDLVAYFCAEFGFQESLPIYSGGLGILAGDHCKAASDLQIPFVAVGLLYRQGYFQQRVDGEGNQHAAYTDSDFGDLPVAPALREDGSEIHVNVEIAARDVAAKVWRAQVGRVNLFLLDTDLEANRPEDRDITHRLYGGDHNTRLEQEIVLGVGGVRALQALNLKPTVWHINEGHSAFLVLERVRNLIREGLDIASALEAVAVNTLFTTHTVVAAGHDHFSEQAILHYFERFCRDLGLSSAQLLGLGQTPGNGEFSMTALAVRGSRFQNGVSRIHGGVSARVLRNLWPQIPPEENPVGYVTNGVHVATFLAPEWADLFDRFLGDSWSRNIGDPAALERIAKIPEQIFWSVHQQLKTQMLHLVRHLVRTQHFRNRGSEAHLDRLLKLADPASPNVLTVGFGRRFATYKRATLLFENLEWLHEIVRDLQRPVLFVFAGKAHPADEPGQELIRRVIQVASMSEFEGKILFVEGYDLHLARRLVSGVDVWLNNPVYPREASGSSGMKAGINGVINLSVLDGWWDEGYQGDNGWAIKPASEALDEQHRNREESRSLYELLQDRVIPMYYDRGKQGFSSEWIKMAKRSIASLLPRFNTNRMVEEYVSKLYVPASRNCERHSINHFEAPRTIAAWKQRVREAWSGVSLRRLDVPMKNIFFGDEVSFEVGVRLNGLKPEDITIELLLYGPAREVDDKRTFTWHVFADEGRVNTSGEHQYILKLVPDLCGKLEYRIRAYPHHPLLSHRFELGLMIWV